jgi:gamma-glutamyltranspeptidase/glutathione hydrolase
MTGFDWEFPYSSRRMPVLARNVVATSQPLAAQAGLRMLLAGGNAVDAALAAAITLTVVEPVMNGIGGDAFALVWDGSELHGLNASGRAPAAWTPQRFAARREMPATGWDAVTVPGEVSGWVALSERFGRLPFAELFAPAIEYAANGFLVSPIVARMWAGQVPRLAGEPGFAEAFLPDGRAPRAGERFVFPDQAHTLERIAATRGEDFYRGELAERMVAHARAHGGALALDDLAAHRADWVAPIGHPYHDLTLYELPPNGQGLAALIALGILEYCHVADHPPDSADSLHLQIEAMKLAFADVYRYVADPAHMRVDPRALLEPGYLKSRVKEIDRRQARYPRHGVPRHEGTVYLTAADAEGMMVSYIQSNYTGFGSGVVVPGTGISLHNRAWGFTLEPGHPNEVGGGKRPFHTIIPGFVARAGAPLMSFGLMGANMQPQGHVQLMTRLADYGRNPQAAIDGPRWRLDADSNLWIEPEFGAAVLSELESRGHRIVPKDPLNFGAAQIAWRLEHGYLAASDPRRDGQALGF